MKLICKKLIIYFVMFTFAIPFITSCSKIEKVSKSSFAFDTVITISIYDASLSKADKYILIDEAIKICNELEDKYSATKETSEVYLYNHLDIPLSSEVSVLLNETKYFNELSGGLFDCSIGKLIELWNVGERKTLPIKEEILAAKNSSKKYLNFGAVLKGYACDKIKSHFEEKGVKSALINLGGNIICIGGKGKFTGFDIGIEEPFSPKGVIKVLNVKDKSIVTSGIYQRYFKIKGSDKIYSHVINPKTGYPIDNGLYSATVISNSSLLGDMLSTTILLMNPSKSELIDIVKKVNQNFHDDIKIILVNDKYELIEIDSKSAL